MTVVAKPVAHPVAGAHTPRTHRHPRWRRAGVIVACVLVGLLLLGWMATAVVTRIINRRLAAMPDYAGHVSHVHIAWWQGGVIVRRLELWSRGHEEEGPIVLLDRASVAVTPAALLRGKLGLRAHFDGAEIMMLKTGSPEKPAKTEEEKAAQKQKRLAEVRRWQGALRDAFPLEFTRVEIDNSRVRFVDRTVDPHPEMALDRVHLVVTGVGRRPEKAGDLPTEAQLTGVLTGEGKLVASIQADPTATTPTFKARAEVRGLALPPLANFMRAYAQVEVTKGTFEVFIEANAAEGHYEGYVKPFFQDLEFKAVRDPHQSALKHLAATAASAVSSLLKNDEKKIATKAPFQGDFADNKVDVWTTVENLLRNAFVQSLREGLEGQRPTR